jgi:FAD/FMN-containing dehydrogenase
MMNSGWNARFGSQPLDVVFPMDTPAVSAALRSARERGLSFRIRSGGHSIDGFSSVDDGIVIDLRNLNSIEIDQSRNLATVGPGVTIGRLNTALARTGHVAPTGIGDSVGLGGHITGGGIGALARWLGAMSDNVESFELVDADGRDLRVSPDSRPDLFWACLGAGGGNFGVITSFTLRITPLSLVTAYRLSWPSACFEQVHHSWQSWAPHADHRLTPYFLMSTVSVIGVFPGDPDDLSGLLEPFLATVPPVETANYLETTYADVTRMMLVGVSGSAFDTGARAAAVAPFLDQPVDDETSRVLREWHVDAPGHSFVWCGPGGGALGGAGTSFAHGRAEQLMLIRSDWTDSREDADCVGWVSGLYDRLRPQVGGAYLSYTNTGVEDRPHLLYRDAFPRLVEVKHRYDPEGVFRFEHGIPGAVSPDGARRLGLPDDMVAELRTRGRLVATGS